ncbi:hypothetical protein HZS_3880 [Henneguya salminicola]|nr:hypothetical protein HZS_3880 [Henneguya salminicola]
MRNTIHCFGIEKIKILLIIQVAFKYLKELCFICLHQSVVRFCVWYYIRTVNEKKEHNFWNFFLGIPRSLLFIVTLQKCSGKGSISIFLAPLTNTCESSKSILFQTGLIYQ